MAPDGSERDEFRPLAERERRGAARRGAGRGERERGGGRAHTTDGRRGASWHRASPPSSVATRAGRQSTASASVGGTRIARRTGAIVAATARTSAPTTTIPIVSGGSTGATGLPSDPRSVWPPTHP